MTPNKGDSTHVCSCHVGAVEIRECPSIPQPNLKGAVAAVEDPATRRAVHQSRSYQSRLPLSRVREKNA
jgi:hypothetical protein